MKTFAIAVSVLLTIGAVQAQAQAPAATAQPAAPPPAAAPTGPAPTGLVVGSGNFFSPIVQDLDKAVAFYRDGLGLDVQGAPGDANANPALRAMFGLPDAKLRWYIARPPASRSGVEIIEVSDAGGKPVERRVQDSGAATLIVIVRDLDAPLAALQKLGAPVVSRGGAPVSVAIGAQKARIVTLKDPAGHFVEIVQPEKLPETQSPATANVVGVRVRFTVNDVERSMSMFRDAMGLKMLSAPEYRNDAIVSAALGVEGGQHRVGVLQVPTTGVIVELIDFKGVDRRAVRGKIQDPGSTRMQLQVRNVNEAIATLGKFGGEVVSTGGKSLDLPAGPNTIKVAIVREPDNLFLVLIQAQPPAAK